MLQNRTIGLRMLMFAVAVIYTVVCYFAFVSLPELKDSAARAGSNRLHPRGSQVYEGIAVGDTFKYRVDSRLDDLRKRLNTSLAELLDINKDVRVRKEDAQKRKTGTGTGTDTEAAADEVRKAHEAAPASAQDGTGALGDETTAKRRRFVREMMKHAWDGYVKYAWGHGEVRPDSQRSHNAGIFGGTPLGASIVDALDTLYLMEMHEEFARARKWVAEELQFDRLRTDVSVFEFTIRYLGGLLSAYSLSHDDVFVEKAKELADRLLPAFDTPSGIPYSLLNLHTKATKNYNWAASSCSILAEVGTLHMEFAYLSRLTDEPTYERKVVKIREVLRKQHKPNGLYRNYLSPNDGTWCGEETSIGALGDSFYEYLLKDWLRTGRTDAALRDMFDEAVEAIRSQLAQRSASGFFYFAEWRNGLLRHRVDHLACYFGGTLALGAQHVPRNETRRVWFDDAVAFTRTCHESYARTATRLGPDTFHFAGDDFGTQTPQERAYLQRPEVIESYFYLWRLTHNETYREWAWDAAQAIEKHCRASSGYSGLSDVFAAQPAHDDVQQSYFFAETLKYLYLIFSPDSLLPLDKWVFNTEAHPFPIQV